ncbi:MAG: hypothetical protein AAGI38_03780 [Bacteroidota bacterium]
MSFWIPFSILVGSIAALVYISLRRIAGKENKNPGNNLIYPGRVQTLNVYRPIPKTIQEEIAAKDKEEPEDAKTTDKKRFKKSRRHSYLIRDKEDLLRGIVLDELLERKYF